MGIIGESREGTQIKKKEKKEGMKKKTEREQIMNEGTKSKKAPKKKDTGIRKLSSY
jgi:hypothetical protein